MEFPSSTKEGTETLPVKGGRPVVSNVTASLLVGGGRGLFGRFPWIISADCKCDVEIDSAAVEGIVLVVLLTKIFFGSSLKTGSVGLLSLASLLFELGPDGDNGKF